MDPLPDDAVHVWTLSVDGPLKAGGEVLCSAERDKANRFRHAEARDLYVAAHVLVREVLSRYVPVDPADWVFVPEGQGKPKIEAPREYAWLQFNLSHTSGMAACGVARGRAVGVDVEHLHQRQMRRGQPNDCLPLAKYCLATTEFAHLPHLEFGERWDRFLRFWTLKEAYLKACATGISRPLQEFAFSWDDDRPLVEFLSNQDDPRQWFFAEHRPSPSHVAAVALRSDQPANVIWRPFAW